MRTNLVASPATFVGRKQILARLSPLLVGPLRARVVTLTGMGGIGKTSLALEVAQAHMGAFLTEGGVWLCDATEARTLEDVIAVVASALDVRASGATADTIAQIARAIAGLGSALIVVDNFEQVVEHAPATIARWSAAASAVTFLVTSRERLRVAGEISFELEPLSEQEAVELLVDRARRVRGGYEPAEGDAEHMTDVVRRVEGIPLAIELCAARMGVLGARQLSALLATHAEQVLERKPSGTKRVTLRHAIEWSWSLLDSELRLALARCSVFRGGWSLEAAMAVVSPELDTMQALHDKSLMRATEDPLRPGEQRYHLYDSVRELAAEKLALFGETEAATQKHAEYYLGTCASWSRGVDGPEGIELRAKLAVEIDNLLAVATRAIDEAKGPSHARAASRRATDALLVLVPLLSHPRLSYALVARLLEQAIHALGDTPEDRARIARARMALARSRLLEGRFAESIPAFEQALASARIAGDRTIEALALVQLGGMLDRFGRKHEAEVHGARARAIAVELADPAVDAFLHGYTAEVHGREGRAQEAAEHYQISLDCFRAQGDVVRQAMAMGSLGRAWLDLGHLEDAESASQQAAAIASQAGDRRNEGFSVSTLGRVHQARGAWDQARGAYESAVALHVSLGDAWGEACDWCLLGGLHLEAGRADSAIEAYERAARMLDEIGDRAFGALARAGLAAAEATVGRLAQAETHRVAATAAVAGLPASAPVAAIALLGGVVDAAHADRAHDDGDQATAELHSARARTSREGASGYDSEDVRAALRILDARLPAVPSGVIGEVLHVGPDVRWFTPPNGERVELLRRQALRFMLRELVARHAAASVAAMTIADLFAAGWPGEKIGEQSAANRVYVSISRLRKLGLGDRIQSRDDGFLLDPRLTVKLER